ncbi:hypothetical protein HOLleu_00962 [Holothuria leucospilota]|uniref:Ig-like domain-containing protein n=1 Tax=Holothuria leucospilota TaxID=206669 RepID=A0A9Q1CNF6_HOLLE|nr:hypothetical protein HOLleu_00962 [Holothuria leucospilota]
MDTLHNEPFLSYSDSEKSGEGYISKEFDIYQNGSLIISRVRTTHEGLFTAIIFYSKTEDPVYYYVRVKTIVKPLDPFPEIDNCSLQLAICLQPFRKTLRLTCVVRNARPEVPLGWKVVSAFEKRNMSSHLSVIRNNTVFTSFATVSQHSLSNFSLLSLFVCETNSVPGVYDKHESLVLVQNDTHFNVKALEPIAIYIQQHSPLKLNCSKNDILWLVWERRYGTGDEFQPLLSAVLLDSTVVDKYDGGYELYEEGTLVVKDAATKNEGTYKCVGSDGIKDTIVIYEVVVYGK